MHAHHFELLLLLCLDPPPPRPKSILNHDAVVSLLDSVLVVREVLVLLLDDDKGVREVDLVDEVQEPENLIE